MRKDKHYSEQKKRTHRGRVWLWLFIVILIVAGATAWVLHDGGIVNWRDVVKRVVPADTTEQVIETSVVEEDISMQNNDIEAVSVSEKSENVEIQPACAVVENLLLQNVISDESADVSGQELASQIYTVLAKYGCPENATFFKDMAARKQAIADGLKAAEAANAEVYFGIRNDSMASKEYLYSDEKICQTIENRVMKNINPNAYRYDEFLSNANTYAVLFEYGCKDDKYAYMRAAVRELGVAVALMPTDKMTRDEIVTVVEICKSLGVAEAAHLMLQRLKARGYDMEFLLEMEDIIHGIR